MILALTAQKWSHGARSQRRREKPRGRPGIHSRETLAVAFLESCDRFSDRVAVVSESVTCTYTELAELARGVARRLQDECGVRERDRVLLRAENSVEYIAGFYGILLADAVAVPVAPRCEANRLNTILQLCEPAAILTSDGSCEISPPPEEKATNQPRAPRNLAAIFFTSGSTGQPKGVMLSHQNFLSNAHSIIEYLRLDHKERAVALLPFYHAFGNSILQSHLLSGGALILGAHGGFPDPVLELAARFEATSLSGVPEFMQSLLTRSSLGEIPLTSLRYMSVAGGALAAPLALELAQRIRPAELYVMYGQTEATARLSYLPPECLEQRSGSIGKGIPGVELRVVDEHDRPISQPGDVGRLIAKGPNVMLGYWHDAAGTAEVLRNKWLETGDLATIDGYGFIYPKGRASELVKISGYRVHPLELETFVRDQFNLKEVQAISFEIPTGGFRLALFLRQPESCAVRIEEIIALCRRSLPPYLVPSIAETIESWPLIENGKVNRRALQQQALSGWKQRAVPKSVQQVSISSSPLTNGAESCRLSFDK